MSGQLTPARYERRRARIAEGKLMELSERQFYPPAEMLTAEHILPDPIPLLDRATPVGSMGSCFAREIKDHLQASGYNYVHYGRGPGADHGSAPWERVFNTGTIRQEVERAFGLFKADYLTDGAGRIYDPYRKGTSFQSSSQAEDENTEYVACARAALTQSQVFIFTLGLSEVWYDKVTNKIFAEAPPKSCYDELRHAFRLLTPEENIYNIRRAIDVVRSHNPSAKFIITVSPIPLRATFFGRSAIVSNHVSKAVLLYTAHAVTEELPNVFHFPSYELTYHLVPNPFDWDSRHVTRQTVEVIMSLFHRTFDR
jgi:hypothetical protein